MTTIDYLSQDHYQEVQALIRRYVLNNALTLDHGLKLANYVGLSHVINLGLQELSDYYPIYGAKHKGRFALCDIDLLSVTGPDKDNLTRITYLDTGESADVPIRELTPSVKWSNPEKELHPHNDEENRADSVIGLVDKVDALELRNEKQETRIAQLELSNKLLQQQVKNLTSPLEHGEVLATLEDFTRQKTGTACASGHAVYVKTGDNEWKSTRNEDVYTDERLASLASSQVADMTGFPMRVLRSGW